MTTAAALAGVVDGIPDAEYHAHPALSSSGAKLLLPPSCPALFRWNQMHGAESKDDYDFGHAVHKDVLGAGAEIRYITGYDVKGNPSPGWATKDAKEKRAQAYADGAIPLLEKDREVVAAMVAAVRAHPIASKLLDPERGRPEQSMFWTDTETGVDLRARIDFLHHPSKGRPLYLVDYKTTTSASPDKVSKVVADYGYHMQQAFYTDAAHALGLASTVRFLFVFQDKTAPYLVTVVQLEETDILIGRALNRQAMRLFAECTATGRWPGYSDEIELVALPSWYRSQHEGL